MIVRHPVIRSARRRLRVGVLDLLATPARSWSERAYHLLMTRQYASITPQAIAVWCRQLGHHVFYATYYGLGDPKRALPDDLDVVFIATYSQASALAYALAKLFRRDGALTVVGGPHAKAFPRDCARFFDVVVLDCDGALIGDILRNGVARGTILSGARPFDDVPTVEERLPEIGTSAFARGRPYFASTIPLLASIGCPYTCGFCIDWNVPHRTLSLERLAADLRFVAAHFPGTMIAFHDPNFAVKFDAVLDVIEGIAPHARSPYIMESSLSILRGDRVKRLADTNCVSAAPGIESWSSYSQKAGVGRASGAQKVERVVEHFTLLHERVPYLQANFMYGLDDDADGEWIALTKDFMSRTPFVWPVVNIPHPFGGTPLFDAYRANGRVLTAMPFAFYYSPYTATTMPCHGPAAYYRALAELFEHFTSPAMLYRRLASTTSQFVRLAHVIRTGVKRQRMHAFRRLAALLDSDAQFRAFHEGRVTALPEFYHCEYERMLGPYAELVSRNERVPDLDAPGTSTARAALPG
jgi:radical SAM superfamily enzyme YgiQ (UPF0313 family)